MNMVNSLTISQAVEMGDRMEKRNRRVTFEEVAEEYLAEPSKRGGGKKSDKSERYAMKLIYGYSYNKKRGVDRTKTEPRFLGKEIVSLTDEDVAEYVRYLRRQPGAKGDFLSGAAQNSYQGVYTSIMNYAKAEKYIDYFPSWKKMHEEQREYVPAESVVRKFAEALDEYRRDLLVFAACTGMRKENCVNIRIEWLDDNVRYITYPKGVVKRRETLEIALSDEARALVFKYLKIGERLKEKYKEVRDRGVHHVFVQSTGAHMGKPYRGDSVTNKKFRAIRKAAGIPNEFCFHTMRHYFATTLSRLGTEEHHVMKAGGWKDSKSVRRYSHVSNEQLREVVNTLPEIFGNLTSTLEE